MPRASREPSPDRFPLLVSAAVLVISTAFALLRLYGPGARGGTPALLLVPVVLAAGTLLALRRRRPGDDLAHTHHQYSLQVAARPTPRLADVCERLQQRGYRLATVTVDELNRPGAAPAAGSAVADADVRLRDTRAAAAAGAVVLRCRARADGSYLILVEADDSGPGLYDEVAQFLIVELARSLDGLELVATGRGPDRRPAVSFAETLPEKPYGLALL